MLVRKIFFKLNLIIFFICFTNLCFASKAWKAEIQPLLWDVEFNGRVQVANQIAHVDKTKLGGELILKADLYKFGVFANIMYSRMSGKTDHGLYVANISNQFSVYTGGFSYELYKHTFPYLIENSFTIVPYAGARYTVKNSDAKITAFWFGHKISKQISQHNQWTDPIVGMTLNMLLEKEWLLSLGGDIGGTSTENQYSYSTLALIRYQSQRILSNISIAFGYQVLDQHYVHGRTDNYLNWNMKITGPVLGVFLSF